MSVIEG